MFRKTVLGADIYMADYAPLHSFYISRLSAVFMIQIDPTIYCIIVVPDWEPNKASPMQGFAPSLCRNGWIIRGASLSPTTVLDYAAEGRETLLARRMSGQFPVQYYPQSPRAVRAMPVPPFMPFVLHFLPDEERVADYEAWAKTCKVRPTFVASSGGDLKFSDLGFEELRRHFLNRLGNLPNEIDPKSIAEMAEHLASWEPMPERKLDYQVGGHGSVTPNLCALTTAGYVDLSAVSTYVPD